MEPIGEWLPQGAVAIWSERGVAHLEGVGTLVQVGVIVVIGYIEYINFVFISLGSTVTRPEWGCWILYGAVTYLRPH